MSKKEHEEYKMKVRIRIRNFCKKKRQHHQLKQLLTTPTTNLKKSPCQSKQVSGKAIKCTSLRLVLVLILSLKFWIFHWFCFSCISFYFMTEKEAMSSSSEIFPDFSIVQNVCLSQWNWPIGLAERCETHEIFYTLKFEKI